MAKYPAQLQSANLNEFGIVYADEVQGHKTVATLSALYAITDPILSKSVVNTGNDAIGQEWYVISEGCYYRLDNWANRHKASGWTKIQVVDTEFNSLSTHGADKIKNFTTSPSTVTLNYNTWRSSTVNADGTAVINAATQSAAGVLSAADKTKLDGLNTDSINDISVTSNANKATITFVSDNGNKEDISTTIDFPISTTTAAGTMSAKDKTELDRITTANFALGAVTPAASSVAIAATKTTISTGVSVANNITLPAATSTTAGVMTSTQVTTLTTVDNRKLFGIVKGDTGTATAEAAVDTLTISGGTDLETVATDTTNNDVLTVNHSSVTRTNAADATATYTLPASGGSVALPKVVKSVTSSATGHVTATSSETPSIVHGALTTAAATGTALTPGFGGKINVVTSASNDGHGHITGITTTSVTIPSSIASTTANGLMSTADKVKLDTTLPNLINSNKTTIDNYTVNGIKISTNPVVTGANTKVTGYSKPTTTGAIAATDSINGALGKLEKKLDDEVTNRTNAVSNLTNTVNNNKTTIDNYTVNGIKISTNPVVTGANTKVTGYSKPTTTGAIAATDSINGALGKLEKKLDDEVTNRTNAVSNLTNTVNNNKTTIDNYTVGGIKISANPKVANGTNTTVSTANSTITWSLNSTISLTRVNASSGFYQTSDKRLKSDIKPLEHTLEEICSIPTDSFILGGKKDLGTIAQELEPTFPELVTDAELKQSDVPNPENFETIEKDGETYVLVKEVDYAKMSVLAIEGIKLLKAEIDELKKQLLDK